MEKIADDAKKRLGDDHKKDTDKPPDFSEWQDFLGEVVLHWFSVALIAVMFRGIPYHDILTEEDYEDIQLDDEELSAIARPFAHMFTHSKLNGKYGRAIMNSRDSIEATVIFFMWAQRANRIAKKYRHWMKQQMEVPSDVTRIPRPAERTRNSEQEEIATPQPGLPKAAFGHGYN